MTQQNDNSGFTHDLAIVGMGYVGLPLATAFAQVGASILCFDTDKEKVDNINAGRQYIKHIPAEEMRRILDNGGAAASDPQRLANARAILICVPTPLTKHRDPDMRFIERTAVMLAKVITKGQLVVLESTTYPGTTREILLPKLEENGLKAGVDFHLAYSPEREDPGNLGHSAKNIPKVVGGLTPECLRLAVELYDRIVPQTVSVSSLETAEATKLMENIFRCVNIALVNELKVVFSRMGIDIWEVVEAAKSKPFGFMPFYPGPGLGGHCIPIDPFYLTWKAREYDIATRFIELAGEVNVSMPAYVVGRTAEELNRAKKCLNGADILILGLAYKKDVEDIRESPSLRLLELFAEQCANCRYHDPHAPRLRPTRDYSFSMDSIPLTEETLRQADAVVIATDHTDIDYEFVGRHAGLVIDTRNAMKNVAEPKARIAKA